MTAEKFDEVLKTLCEAEPFRVFTVELEGGKRLEIDFPVAFRDGVAVYLAPGGKPVFFDHKSVNQIIKAPANAT